jgi:putative lipoic acid-binding regulatory protein
MVEHSDSPPRLSFPCSYPVKVMVRAEPNVRTHVDAIMERHAGPIDLSTVSERSSAQRHFLGITYVIHARSEAQIAELFEALKRCPQVLLVL